MAFSLRAAARRCASQSSRPRPLSSHSIHGDRALAELGYAQSWYKQSVPSSAAVTETRGASGLVTQRSVLGEHSQLPVAMAVIALEPGAARTAPPPPLPPAEDDGDGDDDDGAGQLEPEAPAQLLERVYYVQAGEGSLTLDGVDEPLALRPGDAALAPPGIAHVLSNTGGKTLRVLAIGGPPVAAGDRGGQRFVAERKTSAMVREVGKTFAGAEPTRNGRDWEHKGRCTDF